MTASMRGAVLRSPGGPLEIADIQLDELRHDEVLVHMEAAGVCHSDLNIRDGLWQRPTPMVMGHEGSGAITAIGDSVRGRSVGERVTLAWISPCGSCIACRAKHPWACERPRSSTHARADGSSTVMDGSGQRLHAYCGIGTMASAVIVPASVAIPMPSDIDPGVAALIGCCVSTGVGAVLNTAAVPSGATVAVIGLGGVGMSCVMGAVLAGANCIVAVDFIQGKLDLAVDLGATAVVKGNDDHSAVVKAVREASGGGVDFVFEATGSPSATAMAIELLSSGSTAVIVGIPPQGTLLSVDVERLVNRGLHVVGSKYGSSVPADDFPRYAELHLAGRLPADRLIDQRWALDDVDAAFAAIRDSTGMRSIIDLSAEGR